MRNLNMFNDWVIFKLTTTKQQRQKNLHRRLLAIRYSASNDRFTFSLFIIVGGRLIMRLNQISIDLVFLTMLSDLSSASSVLNELHKSETAAA